MIDFIYEKNFKNALTVKYRTITGDALHSQNLTGKAV